MRARMAYTTKVLIFLLQLTFLTTTSPSHGQPHNIKSLPGYPGDLPFKLETGYVGVGELEKVQLFYYFVESEGDVESDPLVVWLTGGPGCSAFSSLAFEIGPITFNYAATNLEVHTPKLQLNPYSWTKVASVIFLDSPVGTGFSYATTYEASFSDDSLQSAHIYEFLRKWLVEHPEFATHSLYVAGDSYSGMIVPIVVQEILHGNQVGLKPEMNLKGYILGNPVTKRENDDGNAKFKYTRRISLLSDELFKSAWASCKGEFMNVDSKNSKCLRSIETMNNNLDKLEAAQVLENVCVFPPRPTKKVSTRHQNSQNDCRMDNYVPAYRWTNDAQVREVLHIKEGTVDHWVRCNRSLAYRLNDISVTTFGYHKSFTKQPLQALIYSGDQDMMVPYLSTLQWINELNISITDDWRPWFVGGQVAGYVTQFSNFPYSGYRLTYTTIKGGGHTAPEYRPQECLAMLDRWFSSSPL